MENKKLAAVIAAALFVTPCFGASVTCSGTVTRIALHANNTFMLQLSSMNAPVFFCTPEAEFTVPGTSYKTGPQTCKALLAIFLSAKATGAQINNLYFDGDAVPATCNGWASWQSANVRYFDF
jgi:hypothetical protein